MTFDSTENLLVLEGGGTGTGGPEVNLIQKVDRSSGVSTLVAGGWQRSLADGNARIGLPGFHGDGGPAVDSGIWYPIGIGSDSSGNVYFTDYGIYHLNLGLGAFIDGDHSNRIRKISSSGVITTLAGTGVFGYSANGTEATSAALAGPRAIAVSTSGDVYFVDSLNFVIRKIDHTNNHISTIAGTGVAASVLETGTATSVKIGIPNSLAFDSAGNLYFADSQFNVIEKINVNAVSPQVSVVAGNNAPAPENKSILGEGGLATATPLRGPSSLAIDSQNNFYYLDNYGWALRKISAVDHKITTLAGTGEWDVPVFKPTGGSGLSQTISSGALAVDSDGKIFLSDGSYIAVLNQVDGNLSYLTGGYPDSYDSDQKLSPFCGQSSISVGSAPNSQVATIPSGAVVATIPATASLPATTLNFGGAVPDAVTVVPVASNPAVASATPFTISGSTKIVDIQVSGSFDGSATVCLDGAPTDHLYHFTGGAWVELASRSYVNGQVCGVTTSFSPFAAAAPAALVAAPVPVPVPVPDPVQQSKITALSVATAIAGTPTPVEITGSFVEKIRAIQINGVALTAGSWTQTASSVAFTMAAKAAGTYQIQLFNGSAPVLKVQNFTFTAPIVVVAPTPTPTAKPKVTYIRCAKPGHGTRVAYGVNPVCPAGYVKK